MKDLLWKIKKSLDEAGISILFSQLDVWIKPRHARERGGKRLNFIAVARKVMSSAGWGVVSPKPANKAGGAKPQLNAGNPTL